MFSALKFNTNRAILHLKSCGKTGEFPTRFHNDRVNIPTLIFKSAGSVEISTFVLHTLTTTNVKKR